MSFVRDVEKTALKTLFDEKKGIGLHFESPMRRNTKDLSSRETLIPLIDPPGIHEKGCARELLFVFCERVNRWSIA